MGRSLGVRIVTGLAAIALSAGCGTASPNATASSPAAGEASPVASLPANALQALPRPADNQAQLAALLGVPSPTLADDLAALRDEIAKQLGPAVDGPLPQPPLAITAAFHAPTMDSNVLGFAAIDMGIVSRAWPSKQAAATLAGMVREVGGGPGRDGPDRVPTTDKTETTPFDATSTSGSHASGSMVTKVSVGAERSLVTVALDRTLTINWTKEGQSGTSVVAIHNVESVDFCPDAGGIVPVKVQTQFSMDMGGERVSAAIDGAFQGQVDGEANLASITGSARVTGGSSSEPYDANLIGVSLGTGGTVQAGTWEGHGGGAAAAVAAAKQDIESSIPEIFHGAERMWRTSACVTVELPDFGTRASFLDGDGTAFSKDVKVDSKTEFKVTVHHRFQHTDLEIPVKLTLAAEKSIDPESSVTGGNKVTYEAPPQPSQNNRVNLESKSTRGATKYAVVFHTKEVSLKLSITGKLVQDIQSGASFVMTLNFTMNTVELTTAGGTVDAPKYEGTGTVNGQSTIAFQGVDLPCGKVYSTETGTIPLVAILTSKPDGTAVWKVHADQSRTNLKSTVVCVFTAGHDLTGGAGEIAKFFQALDEFEIPVEPGTYNVRGTVQQPIGTWTSTGKVTVYATE